jgi:hypothetical protein
MYPNRVIQSTDNSIELIQQKRPSIRPIPALLGPPVVCMVADGGADIVRQTTVFGVG